MPPTTPPSRVLAHLGLSSSMHRANDLRPNSFAQWYYSPNHIKDYDRERKLRMEREIMKIMMEAEDDSYDRAMEGGREAGREMMERMMKAEREYHNRAMEGEREAEREMTERMMEAEKESYNRAMEGEREAEREMKMVAARERREKKLRERREEMVKKWVEEQKRVQRAGDELAGDLKVGALALREEVTRFRTISATEQDLDALSARVGRFIRLFTRRLETHVSALRGGYDGRVVEAAIEGVISVLEVIYNINKVDMSDVVAKKGAEALWGLLLRDLFFKTGIAQDDMVRWVQMRKALHIRLRGVLLVMYYHEMSGAQGMAKAFQ